VFPSKLCDHDRSYRNFIGDKPIGLAVLVNNGSLLTEKLLQDLGI